MTAILKTAKILISYHVLPHYRRAVFEELSKSEKYSYYYCADDREYQGIKTIKRDGIPNFILAPYREFRGIGWQPGLLKEAALSNFDVYILLANPNFVSTWLAAGVARLRGKKVLFWTHGWLKQETSLKAGIRYMFNRLANKVLVYGERAKKLGVKQGFPADDIAVIYNSLDYVRSQAIFQAIDTMPAAERLDARALFAEPKNPLVICTARLTNLCRFDLLFEASDILKRLGNPINILLVGDGPERYHLEELAKRLDLAVHFYGACYEEEILGQLIYASDITVSPGKIGLTVIHSLSYGTPAITHSDMDRQMPEVEAIRDGVTGKFFEEGNSTDLADKIIGWLRDDRDRAAVRDACRSEIAQKWNPAMQRQLIEAVLEELLMLNHRGLR